MKLRYQIEHQDMGGWQPSHCELADGRGQLEQRLQNLPGRHRYHTQYAILTQDDLCAMQGCSARTDPFYDEAYGLHFDGRVEVFTELGMLEVPFVLCDADCYRTGAGETPDILSILQELEVFRRAHEQEARTSDWAVRMCQAFVAHAGGYQDRCQWTDLLRTRQRESKLSGMKELFAFDWTDGARCFNDYLQAWCRENGVDWRYTNQHMEMMLDGQWSRCEHVNDGDHCTVYCIPPPEEQPEEQSGMQLS